MGAKPHYDLIVVGAGSAGLPCAIRAAESGAKVLLVEKSHRVGGTLHITGGQLSGAGTRRQAARGISDSPDLHFADIQRINHGTGRPDLIRLAVDGAAATINWLEDCGLELAPECPAVLFVHEPYSVPRTYWGLDQGRSILAALEARLAPLLTQRAVELVLSTRVSKLLTDHEGVIGVACEASDGKFEQTASATVLTCGGYSNDPLLFAELHGRPLVSAGSRTSTADGLRMGLALGGKLVGEQDWMPTFGGLPGPEDPLHVRWEDRPILRSMMRKPWEIYVTTEGERFVAEDEPSIDVKERALVNIESLTFFVVFDSVALEKSQPIIAGWSSDDLARRAGVRNGVFTASTLFDLANIAGIDPISLARTVQRYNDAVATGEDADWGRTFLPVPIVQPPFYALENHGITLGTFAGLDVDSDLCVLTAKGERISGLYAAGETIGAAATTGNAFCGGMMITPALTFGRMLGERLARHRHK